MTDYFGRYRAVTAAIRANEREYEENRERQDVEEQVSRPRRERYSKRRRTVEDMIHALLVHDQEGPLRELQLLLTQQGFHTSRARTCAAAKLALAAHEPPRLVFTDTVLPDGTWAEIVDLARQTHISIPVILVSRLACVRLYLEALENGASDFIVPPFRDSDLAHIVRSAALGGGQATLAHSSTAGRTVGEGA
jgi:DNA-binding NtrC family response regulator